MKINWHVRVRNPVFWMTVIPALLAMGYTILGAFGIVPAITQDTAVQYVGIAVSTLTALGVLVDPTTAGMCDSERAMHYAGPYADGQEAETEGEENG